MTNELTVRVQNPVIPAMSWNKDEVKQNLDEMLAAYRPRLYPGEHQGSQRRPRQDQ